MIDKPPVGMDAEDEARFRTSQAEGRRIAQKRRDMARRLLAPPGPRKAALDAWGPVLETLRESRTNQSRPDDAD